MEIVEESRIRTMDPLGREEHRCIKCGKRLISFIAYIPKMGEACMDCYIQAAKKDEAGE
jgi:hypothetical protein